MNGDEIDTFNAYFNDIPLITNFRSKFMINLIYMQYASVSQPLRLQVPVEDQFLH